MSTSGPASAPLHLPVAAKAWCADGYVWVELADGRRLGVPVNGFPRLRGAPQEKLAKVKVEARGRALRWEELDEDLSVEGLLDWKSPA